MVLETYEICVQGLNDRQTANPIFYNVETYLDRLLLLETYIIPNFVKIVRAVLENINIYIYTYTHTHTHTHIYIYIYNFSSFNNKWGYVSPTGVSPNQ